MKKKLIKDVKNYSSILASAKVAVSQQQQQQQQQQCSKPTFEHYCSSITVIIPFSPVQERHERPSTTTTTWS